MFAIYPGTVSSLCPFLRGGHWGLEKGYGQQPRLSVGADSGTHTGTHIYQLVSKPHVLLSWPTVSLRRAHQTPALVSLVIVTLCFHQPFFLECQLMSLQLCTYHTGLMCALKISKLIDHFIRSCPTQAPSFGHPVLDCTSWKQGLSLAPISA